MCLFVCSFLGSPRVADWVVCCLGVLGSPRVVIELLVFLTSWAVPGWLIELFVVGFLGNPRVADGVCLF